MGFPIVLKTGNPFIYLLLDRNLPSQLQDNGSRLMYFPNFNILLYTIRFWRWWEWGAINAYYMHFLGAPFETAFNGKYKHGKPAKIACDRNFKSLNAKWQNIFIFIQIGEFCGSSFFYSRCRCEILFRHCFDFVFLGEDGGSPPSCS